MHIGSNIKRIREMRNLKQEFVASEMGVSRRHYINLEAGISKITGERLIQISQILNVTPTQIVNLRIKEILIPYTDTDGYGSDSSLKQENKHLLQLNALYKKLIEEKESRITMLENQLFELVKRKELW